MNNIQCPKCSYIGPPVIKTMVITGCGNKKISKCSQCQEVLNYEGIIPNKGEKTNDPRRLF